MLDLNVKNIASERMFGLIEKFRVKKFKSVKARRNYQKSKEFLQLIKITLSKHNRFFKENFIRSLSISDKTGKLNVDFPSKEFFESDVLYLGHYSIKMNKNLERRDLEGVEEPESGLLNSYTIFELLVAFAILFYGKNANLNFIETRGIKNFSSVFSGEKFLSINRKLLHKISKDCFIHNEDDTYNITGYNNLFSHVLVAIPVFKFNGWINQWDFEYALDCNRMFRGSEFNRHPVYFNFKHEVDCRFMFEHSYYNHVVYIKARIVEASNMFHNAKIKKTIYLEDLIKCRSIDKIFYSSHISSSQIETCKLDNAFYAIYRYYKSSLERGERGCIWDNSHGFILLDKLSCFKETYLVNIFKKIHEKDIYPSLFIHSHKEFNNFQSEHDIEILILRVKSFSQSIVQNCLSKPQLANIAEGLMNSFLVYGKYLRDNKRGNNGDDKYAILKGNFELYLQCMLYLPIFKQKWVKEIFLEGLKDLLCELGIVINIESNTCDNNLNESENENTNNNIKLLI